MILHSGRQVFVQVSKASMFANVALPGKSMPAAGGTSRSAVKNQRSAGASPAGASGTDMERMHDKSLMAEFVKIA